MTTLLLDAVLLTRLLRPALGAHSSMSGYRVVRQGEDYAAVVASPAHALGDVVVKLAGPRAPGYAERRAMHQLLWCLEYAHPTRQHLADTARVCAALGLAPVSFP